MTDAPAPGHFGGVGLDLPSLKMMIEALNDFVDEALSPQLQLDLDHEDRCPEDIVRAMSDPMTLGVQLVFIPEAYGGMDGGAMDSYLVCEAMARKDIEGWMRGSHYGPLMPVSVKQATPTRFDGPPRVACLGFQLADGTLVGPRDMFDDPSYDEARRDANRIADVLRMHGPFEPHRLPLDDMEYTTMPQIMKKLEGRWAKV